MNTEISVIGNIIFDYKENLKDNHHKILMEQLKLINEKLPKYSYDMRETTRYTSTS